MKYQMIYTDVALSLLMFGLVLREIFLASLYSLKMKTSKNVMFNNDKDYEAHLLFPLSAYK